MESTEECHGNCEREKCKFAGGYAHNNDLLDEALKETFPASDPIAINVDPESPGARNGRNSRHSRSAQRPRKVS